MVMVMINGHVGTLLPIFNIWLEILYHIKYHTYENVCNISLNVVEARGLYTFYIFILKKTTR